MKNKERTLIIVRGLPGAGKTSFAELLGRAVCCADDYLIENGEYKWAGYKLRKAHEWCLRKAEKFMSRGIERVIISNTSPKDRDVEVYMKLGIQYGYRTHVVIVENRRGGISIHNVPEENIEKMRRRFTVKL